MDPIDFTPQDAKGTQPDSNVPKINFTPSTAMSPNESSTVLGSSTSLMGNIIKGAENLLPTAGAIAGGIGGAALGAAGGPLGAYAGGVAGFLFRGAWGGRTQKSIFLVKN